MTMKERLQNAVDLMTHRRDALLDTYLDSLLVDDWSSTRSMTAVETAGCLHDCDRHISNLMMEIKREEQMPAAAEVPNAS